MDRNHIAHCFQTSVRRSKRSESIDRLPLAVLAYIHNEDSWPVLSERQLAISCIKSMNVPSELYESMYPVPCRQT